MTTQTEQTRTAEHAGHLPHAGHAEHAAHEGHAEHAAHEGHAEHAAHEGHAEHAGHAPSRLAAYRERRDRHFAHDDHSPLGHEQRHGFAGLRYFPERPELALELAIDGSGEGIGEHVELQTSDGQAKHFVRAGRVSFEAAGEPITFAVFKDVERGRFFLPFRDGTAGTESYGGGRYLDPRQRPDGTLVVDFNYAYNPYCAYSEGWSCPIPPLENHTKVRIEAGERTLGVKG